MNAVPRTSFFRRTASAWVLAGCLAAAAALRLVNLGAASYWVDEVNTRDCAASWNATGRMMLPSGVVNNRAPVFTAATALGMRLFGSDEAGARAAAAFFGIAAVAAAFGLARALFDRQTAWLTAFLMAFSHFEIGWSRTARMYTLLQLLTLGLVFLFHRGFEARPAASGGALKRLGISAPWLAVFIPLLAVTYWGVHYLAVFIPAGLFLYLVSMVLARALFADGPGRWVNKYSVTAAFGLAAAAAAVALVPAVRADVRYFLSYTPPWATGESSAASRTALLDFLISEQRFPIAAFFFVGAVMSAVRGRAPAWLSVCVFAAPLALLTVVFSHRVPAYLFFVYPFFLATAAFGFVRFLEGEKTALRARGRADRPWVRGLLTAAVLSVFVVSPWLRISLHVPFFGDGVTNMAVTPEEWREASRTVLAGRRPGDLVVTSHPQLAMAYGLRSDYCLNRATREHAIAEKTPRDAAGRFREAYAGTACVDSLGDLERIVSGGARGAVLVSDFAFRNAHIIPPDVRAFLIRRFGEPARTRRGTVLLFRWPGAEGGP